jgi:BON domain
MLIQRRRWQTLAVVPALGAAALLMFGAGQASAQSTSGGSSGSSMSSSGSTSSSGGTTSSLLGTSGSSSLSGSSSGNSLLGGGSSSLSSTGTGATSLTGSTASTYRQPIGNGVGPSPSNIVAPYYASPLQTGLPSTYASTANGGTATNKAFGSPLYVTANNNLNSASASRGQSNTGMGTTTTAPAGISVGPRYTQSLGWKPEPAAGTRLATDLQGVIGRSASLSNPKGIQVLMEGQTVVLRGTAADSHERTLAAAIVSMSPGVYGVRNELTVQAPGAAAVGSNGGPGGAPAGANGKGPGGPPAGSNSQSLGTTPAGRPPIRQP